MDDVRVLVVEDDPRIAEIHRRYVEKVAGFEVVGIAHSLDEARDQIEVLQPELLLLDIYFPKQTGIDLLWEIRAGKRHVDLVLITAAKEVEPLREAMRGGVFDYLIKPASFVRFEATLKRYLETRQRMKKAAAVEQQDVDRLLGVGGVPHVRTTLPKGIDAISLDKVKAIFVGDDDGMSAEEVAGRVGMSRSTARRYLEYLADISWLTADQSYGTVGRPERRFRRS